MSDWLSRAVSFSYTVDGLQAGITRPDGVVTAKTYDGADRLTGVTHSGPGNTPLRHFTYSLDAAGNRTAVTSDEGTESYALDSLGRVLGVTYPQGDTTTYSYDPNGNRLTKTSSLSGNATYMYDDADELLSDGTSGYTYDANGNLLTAGSSVFTWDYANRLATSNVAGVTAGYAYDGEDTRVSKTSGGPAAVYVWDREAGLPTLVGDATNNYLSDLSGSELEQLDPTGTPSYYLGDGLDSVRGTAGMAGTLMGTGDYDVFGMPRPGSTLATTMRFAGEQWDGESSSVYLRARYLSAGTGRFLSVDNLMPNGSGTQGYNLYAYAENNPTTWVDRSGHFLPSLSPGFVAGAEEITEMCVLETWCVKLLFAYESLEGDAAAALGLGPWGALVFVSAFVGIVFVLVACEIACPHSSILPTTTATTSTNGQPATTPTPGPASAPTPPPVLPTPPPTCGYLGGIPPIPPGIARKVVRDHGAGVGGRSGTNPDGKFFTNDWSIIELMINAATRYTIATDWQVGPRRAYSCYTDQRFSAFVGYDDATPPDRNGKFTRCLEVVVENRPNGNLISAYPVPEARC